MRKTLCADDSCLFRSSEVKDNVLFSRCGIPNVLALKKVIKMAANEKELFFIIILARHNGTSSFMSENTNQNFNLRSSENWNDLS